MIYKRIQANDWRYIWQGHGLVKDQDLLIQIKQLLKLRSPITDIDDPARLEVVLTAADHRFLWHIVDKLGQHYDFMGEAIIQERPDAGLALNVLRRLSKAAIEEFRLEASLLS